MCKSMPSAMFAFILFFALSAMQMLYGLDGIVQGSLWLDQNRNGIRDSTENSTYLPWQPIELITTAGISVKNVPMGTDGSYFFNAVAPGTYKIRIMPPKLPYVFMPLGPNNQIDPLGATSLPFTISGNVVTVDVGFQESGLPGVVRGQLWLDVNRNGIRENAENGALLPPQPIELLTDNGDYLQNVPSNPDGSYLFTDILPGSYRIGLPSFYTQSPYALIQLNSNSQIDLLSGTSLPFTVSESENVIVIDAGFIELGLPGDVHGQLWIDVNFNGIHESYENGALLPIPPIELLTAAGDIVQIIPSNPDGSYLFQNIPSGSYRIRVLPFPPNFPYALIPLNPSSQLDPLSGASLPFTLSGNVITVDAGFQELGLHGMVRGQLWLDVNRNGIRESTENGALLPPQPVELLTDNGDYLQNVPSNPDGSYLFSDILPGSYRIRLPIFFTQLPYTLIPLSPNSQIDPLNGMSLPFTLSENVITVDAGFQPSPPAITSISPAVGSIFGGTPINIYGNRFSSILSVTFGGTPAQIINSSPEYLSVISPAHPPGVVTVVVTSSNGNASVKFRYNLSPTITAIPDQATPAATSTTAIPFTIGDDTGTAHLSITATAADPLLVPAISLAGSGANRTIICGAANRTGSTVITVNVSDGFASTQSTFILTVGLPVPWSQGDIGAPAIAGMTTYKDGIWNIIGSGIDIWNTTDQFHGTWQSFSGNVTVIARVDSMTNTNAWAKAGIMIRESTAPTAQYAFIAITPTNGVSFQRRTQVGLLSTHTAGIKTTAPRWLKIERKANLFTGWESADGLIWTKVASKTITMPSSALIMMAVTSHTKTTSCTATFSSVEIIPLAATAN